MLPKSYNDNTKLLLPEGSHQFAVATMAGVMTPHASTKQGEPSEQWGDEVTHIYAVALFYSTLMHDTSGVGNVLYRVETASITHSHDTSAPYCN